MKLSSIALFAAASASSIGEERKFTNDPDFMTGDAVEWWPNNSANKRYKWISNRVNRFFNNWYSDLDASEDKIEKYVKKTLAQSKQALERCNPEEFAALDNRKRREVEDDGDFMDESERDSQDGIDFFRDHKKVMNAIARFVKYEVYDLGEKCTFPGLRILRRLDRMNAYTRFIYCKRIADGDSRCDRYLYKDNGSDKVHPRKNPWHQSVYARPERE